MTTSATFLGKLLVVRLLQLLEAANAELDSTLTANLDVNTILRLIYLFSRIRPDTKASMLRCRTYKAMFESSRKAYHGVKHLNNADTLMSSIMNVACGEITAEQVFTVSSTICFQEAWLEEVFHKKDKQQKRPREVTMQEMMMSFSTMSRIDLVYTYIAE